VKLYLLRHGTAETWLNDDQDFGRQLTEFGEAEVARQAEVFTQLASANFECWVSPYKRTQQTADIFFANAQLNKQTTRLLTPDAGTVGISDALVSQTGDLLLITHQPLVSKLIALLSGRPWSDCPMDTASLAVLEGDVFASDCMELKGIWHSNGTRSS